MDDLSSPPLLGGWCAMGSLYAVATGLDASVFDSTMTRCEDMEISAGCSELPNRAGSWFRVLAADAPTAHNAVREAWAAARKQLLGCAPPPSRRY
jgi:urease accessory protein UreH